MLPLKLKLWTHRFHIWTLHWEKPLIKETCGVANFFRNRNDKQLRMKYVMWRNHVVKLHKNSIRNYFTNRWNDNVGSKNFYKTIKPFLSTKQSHYSGSKIVLKENDSIISDVSKVADIFNMYYDSIAEYKFQSDGLDNLDFDEAIMKHSSHTSISLIKQSISRNYEFSFSPISVQSMSKYISLLKSNKAVGTRRFACCVLEMFWW